MIDRYLNDRQYEASIGFVKHGDGIIAPVKVNSQGTTFCLGFNQHKMREMVAKKGEIWM